MADEVSVRVIECGDFIRRFFCRTPDLVRAGVTAEVQFPAAPAEVYQFLTDEGRDVVACLSEEERTARSIRNLLLTNLGFNEVKRRVVADWSVIMPSVTTAYERLSGAEKVVFQFVDSSPNSLRS